PQKRTGGTVMRMHKKMLIGTAVACLAVAGMLGTKSASANDRPLTVTPAVYLANDSGVGGVQTQLVGWRRGGGGYGWRGGYGWGGYYRPYYGYRASYGPRYYRPYYGGFGYGY